MSYSQSGDSISPFTANSSSSSSDNDNAPFHPACLSAMPPSPVESGYGDTGPCEDPWTGSNHHRATKRQRLSSPARPSLQPSRRWFHHRNLSSSSSSSSSSLRGPFVEDLTTPPDIQRLSLPSLLHAREARSGSPTLSWLPSTSSCPFGTLA